MNELANRSLDKLLWIVAEGVLVWSVLILSLAMLATKQLTPGPKAILVILVLLLVSYIISKTPEKLRELLR
jgi:hypothetical protein